MAMCGDVPKMYDETLKKLGRQNSHKVTVKELQQSPKMFVERQQGWTGVGASQQLAGLERNGLVVEKVHELSESDDEAVAVKGDDTLDASTVSRIDEEADLYAESKKAFEQWQALSDPEMVAQSWGIGNDSGGNINCVYITRVLQGIKLQAGGRLCKPGGHKGWKESAVAGTCFTGHSSN